jgi:hypothetical protein
MSSFGIHWTDLTPEAQARFREEMGHGPEDANWDIFPMTTIYEEDEKDLDLA